MSFLSRVAQSRARNEPVSDERFEVDSAASDQVEREPVHVRAVPAARMRNRHQNDVLNGCGTRHAPEAAPDGEFVSENGVHVEADIGSAHTNLHAVRGEYSGVNCTSIRDLV